MALEFVGAPDWFKEGGIALPYGIAGVPLAYDPPVKDASELKWVKDDKPDGPGLVHLLEAGRARAQARQL